MISYKYKLIFIHIPKTAGSTIEYTLTNKDWSQYNYKHINTNIAKKIYKDYWGGFFKFTFVRNPFDLAVSDYFWTYKNIYPTFQDYLYEKIIKEKFNHLGFYIRDKLNFIGKFENLHNDFEILKQKANLPSHLKLIVNFCKTDREKGYKKYYNPTLIKTLNKIWKKDLTTYNYSF